MLRELVDWVVAMLAVVVLYIFAAWVFFQIISWAMK